MSMFFHFYCKQLIKLNIMTLYNSYTLAIIGVIWGNIILTKNYGMVLIGLETEQMFLIIIVFEPK